MDCRNKKAKYSNDLEWMVYMKENADKYIILLLLMGTSILYLTKADLASVIQMLNVCRGHFHNRFSISIK